MSEAPVLSKEEVDALLKGGHEEKTVDLSSLTDTPPPEAANAPNASNAAANSTAFTNVMDGVRLEWEKAISAFLRKKISITIKSAETSTVDQVFQPSEQKYIYTLFRLKPNPHYGVAMMSSSFLYNTITLLYGGKLNSQETPGESGGKVGVFVAEKLCSILLAGFEQACKEYSVLNYEIIKSTPFVNLLTNLNLEDQVYTVECSIVFDQSESTFKFTVMTDFLTSFFPQRPGAKHKEKDFWRQAINTQVADSMVNVSVTLTDVNMSMHDIHALKEGDTIPISDPTLVYVCLNNLKLFRASAGQSNNKLIAKIISQI